MMLLVPKKSNRTPYLSTTAASNQIIFRKLKYILWCSKYPRSHEIPINFGREIWVSPYLNTRGIIKKRKSQLKIFRAHRGYQSNHGTIWITMIAWFVEEIWAEQYAHNHVKIAITGKMLDFWLEDLNEKCIYELSLSLTCPMLRICTSIPSPKYNPWKKVLVNFPQVKKEEQPDI